MTKRWRATMGEQYWIIDTELEVVCCIDNRHLYHDDRWIVGNYFQFENEAKEKAKKLIEIFKTL